MHNLIRGSHMGTTTSSSATTPTDKPKPHPSARTTTSVAAAPPGGKTDSTKSNVGRNNKSQGPSAEQIARAKEKREAVLRQIRHEKRIMLVAAATALAATPLWIVAIATTHWYSVEVDLSQVMTSSTTTTAATIAAAMTSSTTTTTGPAIFSTSSSNESSLSREYGSSVEYLPSPASIIDVEGEEYLVSSTTGLFRTCRTTTTTTSDIDTAAAAPRLKTREECGYLSLFPSREELYNHPGKIDQHVVDYVRTSLLFALVSLLVMVMALFSAFYTFKNSRYMYKRLAAGLFFIAAGCVLVVVEVVVTLVRYGSSNLTWAHPLGSSYSYGFSFYLGWFVFVTYLANGALFLVLSRKHKSSRHETGDNQQFFGR